MSTGAQARWRIMRLTNDGQIGNVGLMERALALVFEHQLFSNHLGPDELIDTNEAPLVTP